MGSYTSFACHIPPEVVAALERLRQLQKRIDDDDASEVELSAEFGPPLEVVERQVRVIYECDGNSGAWEVRG